MIKVLLTFSGEEKKAFLSFVQSPFAHKNKELEKAVAYLLKNLKSKRPLVLEKSKVWDHVFPSVVYDDQKMRHLISSILKKVRAFLIQVELAENPMEAKILLCTALEKRGVESLLNRELNSLTRAVESTKERGANWHVQSYKLHKLRHEKDLSARRIGSDLPLQAAQDLTHYFTLQYLRTACQMQTYQQVSNRSVELELLPSLLAWLKSNITSQSIDIQLFYWCLLSLEGGDGHRQSFEMLNEILLEKGGNLPLEERREVWLLALNYAIKALNQGEKKMIRVAFELYRIGLEKDVLLDKGILSAFTYKNIARLGLGLDEKTWVKSFLQNYKSKLAPRLREKHFQYNLAYFHFKNKDYDEAMSLLQGADLGDVFNNLDARQMLLAIYYETEAIQALESLLDSFRVFVRRQNIGYQKENYLNLIRFTKRLVELPPYDKAGKEKLKRTIESTTALASKDWLLEVLS